MPHVFEVSDRIHVQRLGRRIACLPTSHTTMPEVVALLTGATEPGADQLSDEPVRTPAATEVSA
jgi:fructose transport system ATP-binding protein